MFYASIFSNGSGAFRETGALRFIFSPEGRTYSPPARRAGGGNLPVGQAVRSPRGMRLLREPTVNAAGTAVPVIIGCAEESLRRFLRLRKPATGSLIAAQGRTGLPVPAFSFAKEKQKDWG